ncbi:unnamed protein product [Arabidopsis arenosa]|uniref:Gnk2-homologous domain-containing protein n=1 Tax=Arabidopsis arenosa TaxID=38785 RepID=A0A8S2B1L5_ARAAE|nr:unnamed protein product [Arabidopsis arenosa]
MSSFFSFIFLLLFSFLTSFTASAQRPNFLYHVCRNTTTYSRNSTYYTNLRTVLSSLSSHNASYSTGFKNATVGQAPNRVTGLFLCRGDLSPEVCRSCVAFSVNQTLTMCPEEKEAVLYYDECMLRYSHQNILSTVIYDGGYILLNANNISVNQADQFGDLVSSTLNQAAFEAANSSRKFYMTKANWTLLQSLYVLVQCTPDLRRQDCLSCLQYSINGMVPFNKIGGRLLYPNCNSRYELTVFYNETAVSTQPQQQAPPPLLPPPASTSPVSSPPRPGKGGNSNVLVVAIVVPIIVVVLLFIAGYCFLAKRKKTTSDTAPAFDAILENWAELLRFMDVCTQTLQSKEDPVERPTMPAIFMMLTSNTVTLPVPREPGYFVPSRPEKDPLDLDQSTTSKSFTGSVDDSSITDLHPR